jgi:hypothetical protein
MEGNEVSSSLLAGGDIHKLPQKERIDAYERVLKEKLYTRSADIVKKGAWGDAILPRDHRTGCGMVWDGVGWCGLVWVVECAGDGGWWAPRV